MKLKLFLAVLFFLIIAIFLRLPRAEHLEKSFGDLNWTLKESQFFEMGEHKISIDTVKQVLVIFKSDKVVLLTKPGSSFLGASVGEIDANEHRGMFDLSFHIVKNCTEQKFSEAVRKEKAVRLSGQLTCGGRDYSWALSFIENQNQDLFIEAALDPQLSRTYLRFDSRSNENFMGAGEQFTHFNLKGKIIPIWVSEQGIGRGAQPLSFLVDLAAGAAGTETTTYSSSGQFVSTENRGFHILNTEYGELDFRNQNEIVLDFWNPKLRFVLSQRENPKELLTSLSEYTGRMGPLPDWVHRGAIVGMQGGTEKARVVLSQLEEVEVPISGFWLQDWVGQRRTSFGKQLWWNWQLDRTHYPAWTELLEALKEKEIRVMGYVNPFLVTLPENHPHQRRLREEAEKKGYLVKDENGQVLDILNTSFSAALLDLSNEEARNWIKDIIKKELVGSGLSGWMADFAEALPLETQLANADPKSFHNQYPVEWAKLNREVIEEFNKSDEFVFFTRAGFTQSPKYSTLFWTGDQMVTWDSYDGLKSSLTGILTGGLSGISLNHSDIGGYTSLKRFGLTYLRSRELLLRWMELNAFTAVFRSHEGNLPDESLQVYSDLEMRKAFAKNAKIFASLFEYRKTLLKEAAELGWPMLRPMWFEYPKEKEVQLNDDQFMLGSDLLVAPVMKPGQNKIKVFLPAGEWEHFITGEKYNLEDSQWIEVRAPIGTPAAFKKSGTIN